MTCWTFAIALIASSIAAFWSAIGPDVDVKTIWPVVPDACGNRSGRVSMPRWDSVPGMRVVVDELAAGDTGEAKVPPLVAPR